jgi:hypothetical protein
MGYRLTLTLISLVALAGCADIGPEQRRELDPTHFTLDTPIEQLAAYSTTASVLRRDIPGLLEDKHYPMFKSMSLRVVGALSNGELSSETLARTEADLRTVSKPIETAALR